MVTDIIKLERSFPPHSPSQQGATLGPFQSNQELPLPLDIYLCGRNLFYMCQSNLLNLRTIQLATWDGDDVLLEKNESHYRDTFWYFKSAFRTHIYFKSCWDPQNLFYLPFQKLSPKWVNWPFPSLLSFLNSSDIHPYWIWCVCLEHASKCQLHMPRSIRCQLT